MTLEFWMVLQRKRLSVPGRIRTANCSALRFNLSKLPRHHFSVDSSPAF